MTCRRSQESRLLLHGHTEPCIAATDLCEVGQAPDTKQWSCRVQVCPLPGRRAGLAPAQNCDRAGSWKVVEHMPLHCLPCPARAPMFGLQPRRRLLVLPKLGCPLLDCPSCSPAWFPHLESHPTPPQLPGERKSASVPHEGTVTTPDQCFPIGFCHPLCFPKASPRPHPTHNLQRLAGSGENSDQKPRKDMTAQCQVGPVQRHQCCAHVTGLALSSRPRNKSFQPLWRSSLTSLMLRLHSRSASSPGAEARPGAGGGG